ncbi:unnamed protein product [Heterosigma akashiwo]
MKLYIAAVLLLLNGASAFIFKSPSVKLSSTPMTMSMEKFDKSKTFFPFESSMPSSTQLMAKKDDSEEKDDRGDLKQLLGIRGASETDDVLRIRIQLTKPVTWIPLIWGVICGAAASGNYEWSNPLTVGMEGHVPVDKGLSDFAKVVTCMILAGPFLTGFTQTINDWYDREIDAINEPNRPIPSGKISEEEVIGQIWFLLLGGLGLAYGIDVWVGHDVPTVFLLSVFGSFISYIYSAPPLKLKQSWVGNYALGASYIALPWWCGQAAFGELTWGRGGAHRALQPGGPGHRHRERLQVHRGRSCFGPAVAARGLRRGEGQVDLRLHHRRHPAGSGGLSVLERAAHLRAGAAGAGPAADRAAGQVPHPGPDQQRRQVPGLRPALPGVRHLDHCPGHRPPVVGCRGKMQRGPVQQATAKKSQQKKETQQHT